MDFSAKNHIFADPPSPPGLVSVDDEERPLPIRQLAQIKALNAKNDELRKGHLCAEAVRPYILRALRKFVYAAEIGSVSVLPSEQL
uniref:Uncharacterized protein n=1 Tax=Globodera pallida TaxID=36090 RepID=A0A183BN04_GLOPA